MLLFYYDLVDKFVDRSNYEYYQMDTDSAYIALDSLKITHRRITITKEAILKDQYEKCDNHEINCDECISEDEAQDMALNERIYLLMKVLFGKSTDEDSISNDSFSSDSSSSSSSSDDESTSLFVSIFNDIVREQYPEMHLSDAAQKVMSDNKEMERILKEVRKKYYKLIIFKEKLDKQLRTSTTHTSISNTRDDYDSGDDDSDDDSSDQVELTSAEKWKQAIEKRKFAIKKDILKNWEELDDTDTDEEEEEMEEKEERPY